MVPTLCGKQGGADQGLDEEMFNLNSTKRDQHSMYINMHYVSMALYISMLQNKTIMALLKYLN